MNVEYLELDQQQQRVFARWLELYAVIREQLSTKYLVFSVKSTDRRNKNVKCMCFVVKFDKVELIAVLFKDEM